MRWKENLKFEARDRNAPTMWSIGVEKIISISTLNLDHWLITNLKVTN